MLFSTHFHVSSQSILRLAELTNGLPYGWVGVVAALQFAIWFFLGIEGTALAAEECRSTARSLPMGTLIGMVTLLVGATVTWFVCSGLVEAGTLGGSVYPLYEAALATKMSGVIVVMFIGTILACMASANGCINDASRAWFAMSRDTLIPGAFSAVHPKYRTPYRAILFLLPISLAFGFTGLLDQVITFSILSALLVYLFMGYMMFKFRKMYPMGSIDRGYVAPWHPLPAKAMKAGLEVLKPLLSQGENEKKGTIIIGTVKGDLHDIGKNLVAMMMEGAGFEVIDLGVDVDTKKFLATAKENNADIICMSALLTTTMPFMEVTVKAIREQGLSYKTMVGGAPVSEDFATKIGADGWSTDAPGAVETARRLTAK